MQISSNKAYTLDVTIRSWNAETSLFFYKEEKKNEIVEENLEIEKYNSYIIRNIYNEISQINNNIDLRRINNDYDIIFKFRKSLKKDEFELINPIKSENLIRRNKSSLNYLDEKMWLTVKPAKIENSGYLGENDEDYKINKNDILKFGRKKYEVRELNINKLEKSISTKNPDDYNISELNKYSQPIFKIDISKDQYIIQNENDEEQFTQNKRENYIFKCKIKNSESLSESSNSKSTHDSEDEKDYLSSDLKEIENYEIEERSEKCRICFGCNSSKENPLLLLCKCHDYIHFQCLKLYLQSKVKISENGRRTVTTYAFDKCNCEVCLTPYPTRFRIPKFDKIYDLVDINLPSEIDYVILESLDYIKEGKNIKLIHLVQLKDDYIYIGRHTANDIVDGDISVSRFHSQLRYDRENGDLFLENRSEKFGTLVLIRGNIKMKSKPINFQVGRTYITAKLEEKFILMKNPKVNNQNEQTEMQTFCN